MSICSTVMIPSPPVTAEAMSRRLSMNKNAGLKKLTIDCSNSITDRIIRSTLSMTAIETGPIAAAKYFTAPVRPSSLNPSTAAFNAGMIRVCKNPTIFSNAGSNKKPTVSTTSPNDVLRIFTRPENVSAAVAAAPPNCCSKVPRIALKSFDFFAPSSSGMPSRVRAPMLPVAARPKPKVTDVRSRCVAAEMSSARLNRR